jgi:hypothetical protein
MLPGFRFLFAAIVLSMSILVFGLGAAALLRAAHEEFASTPSWHAPPETMFAQQADANRPVLALLRINPPAAEKAPDDVAAVTAPTPPVTAPAEPAATGSTPPEQAAIPPTPAEPDRIAALQPADSPAPAAATSELPVAEHPPQDEAAPAPDATAAPQAAAPVAADETKVAVTAAATEQVPAPASEATPATEVVPAVVVPAIEAAPAIPEPAAAPSSTDAGTFSTKIATLGGLPVTIGPAAKAANPKPDKGAIKKREQAKRVHRRRRIVARAQVAAQTQPVDPFAQPAATPSRPSRSRKPR